MDWDQSDPPPEYTEEQPVEKIKTVRNGFTYEKIPSEDQELDAPQYVALPEIDFIHPKQSMQYEHEQSFPDVPGAEDLQKKLLTDERKY